MANVNGANWISELDKVRDALGYVDSTSRDDWLIVGAALKRELGQDAFDLWDEWSSRAESYNAKTAKYTWDRFKPGKAGLGTVFHLAKQGGFDPTGRIGNEPLSAQAKLEQAELRAKRAKEQAEEIAKKEARYSKVANLSSQIWQSTIPAGNDHPYLARKGISGENLHEIDQAKLASLIGYAPKANDELLVGRILLAAVKQNDSINTLELIDENGRKSALAGGRKLQSYWVAKDLAQPTNEPSIIYIGEGIATTRSIEHSYSALQADLGLPDALIVASLSTGNMPSVALALRAQYPSSLIVIASDLGPGEQAAIKVALMVGGLVSKPNFSDVDLASQKVVDKNDFNDLQLIAGDQKVVVGLLAAQTPQSLGYQLVNGQVVRINEEVALTTQTITSASSRGGNLSSKKPFKSASSEQNQNIESVPLRGFNDADKASVELQISDAVKAAPTRFIDLYKNDLRSHGGLYINVDLFKETFEPYRQSKESRDIYNLPVHNSATMLANMLFHQNLEIAQSNFKDGAKNQNRVILIAGMPGAGKSNFVKAAIASDPSIACIYEGQLDNLELVKSMIAQSVDMGMEVDVLAVHSKAVDSLDASLQRFETIGRGATIDDIAASIATLPSTLELIAQAHGEAVKLTIVDRTDPASPLIARGWDHLPKLFSEGNYETIKHRLSSHLEQRYQSRSISQAIYSHALNGSSGRPFLQDASKGLGGVASDERGSDNTRRALLKAGNESVAISDFGEKIGGARKDVWTGYLDRLKSAQTLAAREVPFSQYWPEPNYQKLIEAGQNPEAIAYLRALRDVVPSKPKATYKLSRWSAKVEASKSLAGEINEVIDQPQSLELIFDKFKAIPEIADRATLYQIASHKQSLASYQIKIASYSMMDGITYNPAKTLWSIEEKTKGRSWPKQLIVADTRQALLERFSSEHQSLLDSSQKSKSNKDPQFVLYRKRAGDPLFIAKKIGRRYIDLAGPFLDVKEARDYRSANLNELEQSLAKLKEVPAIRALQNEPRLGIDYRGDQNITPQEFNEVFGFRGVEFGNWVEQGRRQSDLNEAYDALMDLSKALALPPAALSLNGELGLAFGARGRGGVDPAKAHYEAGHVVINLTKEKGAGSLAHEWWHALDNYLVRTNKPDSPLGFVSVNPQAVDLRNGLQESFVQVMEQIQHSNLPARSAKMDEFRSSAYWATPIEMSARCFEGYVGERLSGLGIRNDYLVNYLAPKEWNSEDLIRYPYPVDREVESINGAFGNLFAQVQTRQTDKGMAIYSEARLGAVPEAQRLSVSLLVEKIDQLIKPFKSTIPVKLLETTRELGAIDPGFVVSGVTHQEHIFLIREGLGNIADVEKTLWHEMLHFGLRRFLTKDEYSKNLNELYNKDQWIANKADRWIASPDGQDVLARNPKDPAYVKARGVDEALADLAEIIQTNPSGYQLNSFEAKAIRTVRNWVAVLADKCGFPEAAKQWRAVAAGKEARDLVANTFSKLREGATPVFSPSWNYSDPSFKQASSDANDSKEEKQFNVAGQFIAPAHANFPSSGDINMAKQAKTSATEQAAPSEKTPEESRLSTSPEKTESSRSVGEPLYDLSKVPHEVRTAASSFFGSRHNHYPPRENGGPYKGEVLNTSNYLVQEVSPRALVFHDKSKIEYKNDKIAALEKDNRINGLEVKINYEGDQAKVRPYDRMHDNFLKVCREMKESAEIMAQPPEFTEMLNNIMASSWERMSRERLEQLQQVRQPKKQLAPDHTIVAPAPSAQDAPTRSR